MFLIREGMSPFRYVFVQGCVFLVCLIFIYFMVKVLNVRAYRLMKIFAKLIFYFSLISLCAVFLVGATRGGAQSVISIGPFDYQPMELYKVSVILYLSIVFHECQSNQASYLELAKQVTLPFVGLLLILIQPDLGGFFICGTVIVIAILLNGRFLKQIILLLGALVGIGLVSYKFLATYFLQDYQLARITNWKDPFADAQNASYQTVQSLIGISNGGISGVGYMNSLQKTFLDAGAATDYIFIVICEEWGLMGAVLTIGLLMGLAYICIMIGLRSTERFGQIFATTYGSLIMVQAFINIGGVTNFIPMTGVTLPFISNGMNSLVFLSAGILACLLIDVKSTHDKNKIREKIYMEQQIKLDEMRKLERRNKNLSRYGGA